MSGRKNVLAPIRIEHNHSLAASFNSTATIIDFLDNVAYQVNVLTSNSTGFFEMQASLDYDSLSGSGNWVTLTLGGGIPAVTAANESIMIYLNQLPYRAVRLKYTATIAGTGTADIYIMSKMV